MNKNIAIGVLAVIAVLFAVLYVSNPVQVVQYGAQPGPTYTNEQEFLAGASFGSGGENLEGVQCYSNASYNPGSVSSTTLADALAFLTPNATVGDFVVGVVATTTSATLWRVDAAVTAGSGTATASSTLYLRGIDGIAVNLTTTTAKICIFDFE